MPDFNEPTNASEYAAVLAELRDQIRLSVIMHYQGMAENIPAGAVQLDRGTYSLQEWNGTAWASLSFSVDNIPALPASKITSGAFDVGLLPVLDDPHHGSRGGGALHAVATPSAAGFLSAADKAKLDGMSQLGNVRFNVHRSIYAGALPLTLGGFNHSRYSVGSAFDLATGVFTAPVSGYYRFGLYIDVEGDGESDHMGSYSLYKNGSVEGVLHGLRVSGLAHVDNFREFELHLSVGDEVDFRQVDSPNGGYTTSAYALSGSLVYAF